MERQSGTFKDDFALSVVYSTARGRKLKARPLAHREVEYLLP
jgi:hypothetical protein